MDDLFEREQNVLEHALSHLEAVGRGSLCSPDEFASLVHEYAQLLKQLRQITKMSDKTTVELNASKQRLMEQVRYDSLTSIYNRRFMESSLLGTMQELEKRGGILSVLMIDVDFFKKYNDTYGHSEGDQCLRIVARALWENAVARGGFAARYGGEEFVIALPDCGREAACLAAQDILDQMRELGLAHKGNEVADYVTVSIGVTTGLPLPDETGERFMLASDKALYQSKQGGRDRYTFIELKED